MMPQCLIERCISQYTMWRRSFEVCVGMAYPTVLGDRQHVCWREGCATAPEICVSLQFCAIDTTFLTRRLRDGKMKFALRYSFGRSTPRFWREGCARANKIWVSLQFWAIDTTFLTRRSRDGKMKLALRYSFGRSTPRLLTRGLRDGTWNLRFATVWAIDTTFLTRGLRKSKQNLRLATVLDDRHHVFDERVAR